MIISDILIASHHSVSLINSEDQMAFPDASSLAVIDNSLHFVLFFIIYNVRWWSNEVGSVLFGFLVWLEEDRMENRVHFPMLWQSQFVIDFTYHLFDFEWSFSSGFQLGVNLHFQVPGVQQYCFVPV
jgi:hypothetical protein